MKISKIDDLAEGDVLAQDVLTNGFQILLGSGTVLKREYISKLKELGVREVRIEEPINPEAEKISILREEIEKMFLYKVREVLENHIYQHGSELMELSRTADVIITEILENDKVIEKVYDIKERSADMYEHSISLCTLTTIMALKYRMDRSIVHDIGLASLLHDVGLRCLTSDYKNKELTDMSEFEYAEYKKHPIYAYTSLKNETWLSERCKNMILMHHERLNGLGYPLHATSVPREVQIIAVCDAFDEMICGLGCVRMKVYQAIEILKSAAGTYLDAEIISMFLHFIAVYPIGTKVCTNEGEVGIVIKQNPGFPSRPQLRMIQDKDGKAVNATVIKDLVKELTIFVEKVLEE